MIILAGELMDDSPMACCSGARTDGFFGVGCDIVADELRMFSHPGVAEVVNPSGAVG